MNWIRFALSLSAVYLAYYAVLICWDFLRNNRLPEHEKSHVLSFEEHWEPVREVPDTEPQIYDSLILSSGGVSLKQLFNLAREEAVEYIRPVSF